ncbi:MAG: hypothetical protein MJD61_00980, partial [Proteobacteria bacterium]|nr:hypothetical protein [Pseudomonadota bacterium]
RKKLAMDSSTLLVGINFHVFVDQHGNGPSELPTALGLARYNDQKAWARAASLFIEDNYVVDEGFVTYTSNFDWGFQATTSLTHGTNGRPADVPDETFLSCGVQFVVSSVDFIRESHGLERVPLPVHQLARCPCCILDLSPLHTQLREIIQAYRNTPGIHVFVAEDATTNSELGAAGMGCSPESSGNGMAWALLLAGNIQTTSNAYNTLTHELGHVLGLEHGTQPDEIGQLLQGGLPRNGELCSRIRTIAEQIGW